MAEPDRRPIAARQLQVSQSAAQWMARRGIQPNQISLLGMFAGIAAGLALAWTQVPSGQIAGFLIAAVCMRLEQKETIYLLFPEGTRSRDGNMKPFRPGIGMLVAGLSVPVVPCYLEGTFAAFPPNRLLPTCSKIRLFLGPPRTFATLENQRANWVQVSQTLHDDVTVLKR